MMFRNRKSSQKPGDEFIASFRQNFPEVATTTTTSAGGGNNHPHLAAHAGAPDRHHSVGEIRDLDPTPRAQHEIFRFPPSNTPSHHLDPNFQFSPFGSQSPGTYYATTPAVVRTMYHNKAGDLHTPGMGMGMTMGLGTPLSLPTSTDGLHSHTLMDMSHFDQHMPSQYHPFDSFLHSQQTQQTSFAPSSFNQQDTGYETMDHDGSPMDDDEGPLGPMERAMHQSPLTTFQPRLYDVTMSSAVHPFAEKFRYQITLNAPTAMIKYPDEIPVTYLNKGQAYTVSVVDSGSTRPLQPGTRYRTFIRISFEDEEQRERPASCWQLWKEGRGTNEAHLRGGKLQAVEYVETNQNGESDDRRTRVELDTASFDGFSVIWTPGVNGAPECNIAVRFNFLSTDFSHSKGVKGIPVRFCAKTETLPSGSPHANDASEVAFCKVKLFRDHGAERKLSNDIAHVKKTIEKLKQQINQAETGMKDFGKRKRGSTTKAQLNEQRPGKVQKHKRTWSMSSASSAGGRVPMEDLHFKLQNSEAMFLSPRPVSTLYLRGSEQDDPDLHPVALAGEPLDLTKVNSHDNAIWAARSSAHSSTTGTSSIVSRSPSSISLQSQAAASASNPLASWADFQNLPPGDFQTQNPQHLASPPDQLTKVLKSDDAGGRGGWIEALGVDSSYNPPIIERSVRPVACFYVLLRDPNQPAKHEYYRAIYLMQRTLKDFTGAVALKWNIEPTKILRTIRVLDSGLQVEMDDDIIRELSEGQDFILEVHDSQVPIKLEWEMDVAVDVSSAGMTQNSQSEGYELRLTF
ncbi:hypothetical protein DSL72_001563 [Monilinia vaccinii-corymbosi]|uniref:Grh/CP2 DB domain-containing protein n=1 Tax=Monilinia vaccinii-corymbosi TaxID=61207 RepID=A0A8A3P654_9HELO|nr:hypothetical protein DSL72_001563 [Monilinia vaccinii-corymbosi]